MLLKHDGELVHHSEMRLSISFASISLVVLLVACGDDASSDAGADAMRADTSTDAPIDSSTDTSSDATVDSARFDAASDAAIDAPVGSRGAVRFVRNAFREHDYSLEATLPSAFGEGELTFEMWMRLDASFPVGPADGGESQLTDWCDVDNEPYSDGAWWYKGNFLLDGHNNNSFEQGTFSLQFYGGGRLRWLFGDGSTQWSVGVYPATGTPSLLDDAWHAVALVRRFEGGSGATLELWIDGVQIATETSDVRTNMRTWWDTWDAFPEAQPGWFWGAEKQAAVLVLDQYEDYKGEIAELRYWTIARSEDALAAPSAVTGGEAGLVGWIPFDEGTGDRACDALDRSRCMIFMRTGPDLWTDGPAL